MSTEQTPAMTPNPEPAESALPCPFCGSEALIGVYAGEQRAWCDNESCALSQLTQTVPIQIWNRRPPTDPAPTAAENPQSETGTPRTDSHAFHETPGDEPRVFADFARTLERELQESRRENERLKGRLQSDLAEARAQLAESEATSKEAVMRMREQSDTFTAQLAKATAERDALKIWHDLGKLTVAISNGESLPASSSKLDDNPVNCVSFLLSQRDDLKALLEAARKDSERLDWMAARCYWPDDHPESGVFAVVSEDAAPHGLFTLELENDRVAFREAIDAAISAQP